MNFPQVRSCCRRVTPLALVAVAAVGCGATVSPTFGAAEIDKAGPAEAPTVTLTLASAKSEGLAVTEFVEAVADLSGGTITVEATQFPPTEVPAWEQAVIGAMDNGDFDLSYSRAGAWESSGVVEMRPLQLPGVVRNDAQVDAVTSAPVADEILAGLADADAVGLGLYPENLRHLALYANGPISLDSLQGQRVRIPLQPTVFDWLAANGAEPVDLDYPTFEQQVGEGTIHGSDVSLAIRAIVPSGDELPAVITANVPLYSEFGVLAMSESSADALGDAGLAVLQDAAAQARTGVIDSRPREHELAQGACDEGMVIAAAPDDALDEIVEAAAPVIDEVAADPTTGPILEALRDVAGDGEVDPLPTCHGQVLDDPSALTPNGGDLPNGIYRFEVTAADIAAAGLPEDECLANCGTYTWTMRDGHYEWAVDWPEYPPAEINEGECCWLAQEGVYEVHGDTVSMAIPFLWDADPAFVLTTRWQENPDNSLSFTYVDGSAKWERWIRPLISDPDWVRIGDA